jgi:DNA repair protein RecN (Recombination protein N)
MLWQLSISNLAIIEDLQMAFEPGLTIISGETGAGKSILINAVNLILGGRASSELIRSGCEEARIEALFTLSNHPLISEALDRMGISFDGELLVRRSISREGRSRVFINGSIATVQMLSAIGPWLMSVSGQHEYQGLLRPENHLFLLDAYAGLMERREAFSALYREHQGLKREALSLAEEIGKRRNERELALFQIEEIEKAAPLPGEDDELAEEKRKLQHAEELQKTAQEAFEILYEGQESIISSLSRIVRAVRRASELEGAFSPVAESMEDAAARLEDASFALRDLRARLKSEPERLERVLERLEVLGTLKRKYGPSLQDVIERKKGLLNLAAQEEEKARLLEDILKRRDDAFSKLLSLGKTLSQERREAAEEMERQVEGQLEELHLKGTRFKVSFSQGGKEADLAIGPEGMDRVEFLLAANVGEELKPLSKIASGGELSRIMLALKTILAKTTSVETVIFDEVDSGISGATAEVVGEKLRALSSYHQVICITHLPQIAGKGSSHYLVRKDVIDGRTKTTVSLLKPEERLREVARLLGGREITEKALAHAADLLR